MDDLEMPVMKCPQCGAEQTDFDGLSFSYCPVCGYCSHPNSMIENGIETCGICGRQLKTIHIGIGLYKTVEVGQ
jgi:hypothetical protein